MKLQHFLKQSVRPVAAALLVALAFVQLVEFSHQGEHSLADAAERCTSCIQLDQFAHGASAAVATLNIDQFTATSLLPVAQAVSSLSRGRPSARAPPLS